MTWSYRKKVHLTSRLIQQDEVRQASHRPGRLLIRRISAITSMEKQNSSALRAAFPLLLGRIGGAWMALFCGSPRCKRGSLSDFRVPDLCSKWWSVAISIVAVKLSMDATQSCQPCHVRTRTCGIIYLISTTTVCLPFSSRHTFLASSNANVLWLFCGISCTNTNPPNTRVFFKITDPCTPSAGC